MKTILFLILWVFSYKVDASTTQGDLCVPMKSNSIYELALPKEVRHNEPIFKPVTAKPDAFNINVSNGNSVACRPLKTTNGINLYGGSSSAEGIPVNMSKSDVYVQHENVVLMNAKGDDHDPHAGYECPNCRHKSSHFKHEDGKWYCASCGKDSRACEGYNPGPEPIPGSPIGNGGVILILMALFYCLFLLVKGEAKEENMRQ